MKQIASILMMWLCLASAVAQDMKRVFIAMPDSIVPLLTKVNREDCVDFLASNMKAVVKNRFDNESELKVLSDDYLLMQVSEAGAMEMKLLPLNDSVKVVCLVQTVCASACDSRVRFFDTRWHELDADDYLRMPPEDVFYLPQDSVGAGYDEARLKADLYLMKASLAKDTAQMTLEYTTPHYLNEEDRTSLRPFLRTSPVVLEWEDGRFVLKSGAL